MSWTRQNQKFGYLVDGRFYHSKISALVSAGGNIDRVSVYFLDNDWKNVDWTKEPPQSFKELIDLRCHQIRDSYKFVSLFFSGGYDSMTILNGFLRNQLPLDEIIVWDRTWLSECQPEIQYAKNIAGNIKKNTWPNVKITYQQKDADSISKFYRSMGRHWIEHPGSFIGMQKNMRDWEFETSPVISGRAYESGTVVLEGRDKPRVNLRDGKWYSMMNDKTLGFCMGNSAEQFYFSPNFPELYIKQCYMMIDWMEKSFNITHELVHEIQSFRIGPEMYARLNVEGLGRDPIECYQGKYGINKLVDQGGILSRDNQKLAKHIKESNPVSWKIWNEGINEIKTTFNQSWDNSANDLRSVIGQQHYLRDLNPRLPEI